MDTRLSKSLARPSEIPAIVSCDYQSAGRREDGKYIDHTSIPHLCHLELTYACNQFCPFCYNPVRTTLGNFKLLDRVVESIACSQIPHVCFLGGEPSLLPVGKLNEYIDTLADHSSVTITTNGRITLKSISERLAFIAVPLHGTNAQMHEFLNNTPGSFAETIQTIRYYVNEGRVVRAVPLLNGYNYNQMYDIVKLAADLGMESVYVDRYEDGGIGAQNSINLAYKPTREQFAIALGQIIKARNEITTLGGRVGFGTAVPYCLDTRLIADAITCNCGVGRDFCAINPMGDVRMCNQSQLVFGNVLEESLEDIWNKPSLDIFRDLSWVSEPCKSCQLLLDCTAGCKVDVNYSDKFCIDYAVRGRATPINPITKMPTHPVPCDSYPEKLRIFRPSRYMKITTRYPEKLLVTRYQTAELEGIALEMAKFILKHETIDEQTLINRFSNKVDETETRLFVSKMLQIDAIELV